VNSVYILNAEPHGYSIEARSIVARLGQIVEGPLSRQELLARIGDYEVLIVRLAHQINREVIDSGKRLKVVVSATTGLDHIDVDYAAQKGIEVLSLKGEAEFLRTVSATAEHTWALLLALLRRIPRASLSVKNGEWDRHLFRGRELDGKRLGIIGLGRIGRKVARYGQAFGMDVAAHDPFVSEWVDGVKRASRLPDLLRGSEVLTIHVPLNKETYGMISREEISLLPVGSVVVNTSRGEVLDENALLEALQIGHLAGAALDVICHERDESLRLKCPLLAYLCGHDNLILTPHIGGATYESMEKTEIFMAHKLAAFLYNL
jgi:D-3-phosphoglycerate dehydrogenase